MIKFNYLLFIKLFSLFFSFSVFSMEDNWENVMANQQQQELDYAGQYDSLLIGVPSVDFMICNQQHELFNKHVSSLNQEGKLGLIHELISYFNFSGSNNLNLTGVTPDSLMIMAKAILSSYDLSINEFTQVELVGVPGSKSLVETRSISLLHHALIKKWWALSEILINKGATLNHDILDLIAKDAEVGKFFEKLKS